MPDVPKNNNEMHLKGGFLYKWSGDVKCSELVLYDTLGIGSQVGEGAKITKDSFPENIQ